MTRREKAAALLALVAACQARIVPPETRALMELWHEQLDLRTPLGQVLRYDELVLELARLLDESLFAERLGPPAEIEA